MFWSTGLNISNNYSIAFQQRKSIIGLIMGMEMDGGSTPNYHLKKHARRFSDRWDHGNWSFSYRMTVNAHRLLVALTGSEGIKGDFVVANQVRSTPTTGYEHSPESMDFFRKKINEETSYIYSAIRSKVGAFFGLARLIHGNR